MDQFAGLTIVAHGGAGGSSSQNDGCRAAAAAGMGAFQHGGSAFDAVIAAVVVMEDDPRFNAGTGAVLGLDGKTVELDACVMDSRARLGAVACLQNVRNPVLVASDVTKTPHCLLAGEGALQFARMMGHPYHDCITERTRRANEGLLRRLRQAGQVRKGVPNEDFARYWNYASPRPLTAGGACDTVGAVARGPENHFAVAGSTGGSAPSLLGRVGDTPLVGSGFYAGAAGAVAATGVGEHIIRHLLAISVYRWIEDGMALQPALQRGVDLFDPAIQVGLIAVSRSEAGSCSNGDMPTALVR